MTNPQYLLLDAKWLEEQIKDSEVTGSTRYCSLLQNIKYTAYPIFPNNEIVEELRECARLTGEFNALYERAADEINRLQKENFALASNQCHDGYGDDYGNHRCREVDKAVAAEREACAQIAHDVILNCQPHTDDEIAAVAADEIEKAIRARGDEDKS